MADRDSPFVQRRRLAKELRQIRLDNHRTVQQVAALMECSSGKISRIETGAVGAQLGDVRDLLDIYDVHGADRTRILDLVRKARRRTSWWHEYAGVLPPDAMRFFGLEDGATLIDDYSGNLIPGLLQTDGYGRALIATARDQVTTAEDVETTANLRTRLRLERQHLLIGETAPTTRFVLNEAALAVRFGGPAVMADQLDHLLTVADQPKVTIQVLPLSAEAFAAAGGIFTIFTFANPDDDPPIVHIDGRTFSHYRENLDEVDVYRSDFQELLDKACDPQESISLLRRWSDAHRESSEQSA